MDFGLIYLILYFIAAAFFVFSSLKYLKKDKFLFLFLSILLMINGIFVFQKLQNWFFYGLYFGYLIFVIILIKLIRGKK